MNLISFLLPLLRNLIGSEERWLGYSLASIGLIIPNLNTIRRLNHLKESKEELLRYSLKEEENERIFKTKVGMGR